MNVLTDELFKAIKQHDTEKIKEFIDSVDDVNIYNYRGYDFRTPLHHACSLVHADIARLLIDAGADMNAGEGGEWTPLHDACEAGHAEIVRLLLENGVNVNVVGKYSLRPLHIVAIRGCTDIARLLIENGADVNARNKHGHTPLHRACVWKQIETVKFFIDHGADVDAKDDYGRTPLDAVAELPLDTPDREELLEFFRDRFPEQYFRAFCEQKEGMAP